MTIAVVLGLLLSLLLPAVASGHGLQFRGQAIVPTGTQFQGTNVGGLSSITYDEKRGVYYVLSDDQVAARFYTVGLDVRDGRLSDGDVRFTGVTTLPYTARPTRGTRSSSTASPWPATAPTRRCC